ncbi:orotidine-5'-phosphate decarboxylase [Roseomonas frigidaquae]|uniref:Orotidine 5'-phosphate decarboxylase n=1 Tax=Falsiroseomonas frigidaquae TaxID=487318 RepID=A0ABX1EXR9_9PROT|nr:orotidine-5'-phosphate decarboxylase [Falsiroseomonas frigidaquae]NKE44859.1 orotidine-5'-phosphate decarboxylase [Falsiroseomonas frigidaquae]
MRRCGLCVALDAPDLATAESWAGAVAPHAGLLKVGLELFSAEGGAAVRRIAAHRPVFLDVKLHDIPNTVAGAIRSLAPLGPAWITVHAAGGAAMVEAARKAAEAGGGVRPRILAVTVLTSLDAAALAATGVAGGPVQQVLRLARLAMAAGADGLVCSPREVRPIRDALGELPVLVVPGVRPAGSAADDQARTATPEQVARDGADWIVVGRPITQAADPGAAARAIAAALG